MAAQPEPQQEAPVRLVPDLPRQSAESADQSEEECDCEDLRDQVAMLQAELRRTKRQNAELSRQN